MPSGSERALLTPVPSSGVPMQSSGTHVGLEELSGGAQGFTPRQVTHTSPSAVPDSAQWAQYCPLDVSIDVHIVQDTPPKQVWLCAFQYQQ